MVILRFSHQIKEMLFEFSQVWEREEDQFAEKQTCVETFFLQKVKKTEYFDKFNINGSVRARKMIKVTVNHPN